MASKKNKSHFTGNIFYHSLKELTRKNEKISRAEFSSFIDNLKVSDEVKKELKAITPFNYTGKFIP